MSFLNLDKLCRVLAPIYLACGYAPPTPSDVLDLAVQEEKERTAKLNASLASRGGHGFERRLLRDEKGVSYGETTAEIPMELYFKLLKDKKRFGPAAMQTKEGIKEVVKAFPECGVRHVDQKYHGHTPAARRQFGKINWRGSTMKFAS